MNAVILAGGKGIRMGTLTRNMPKPMLKIDGKPILEHQINWLKRYRINEVIILTSYLGNTIESYFGDGQKLGMKISYYREAEPLGTTGGLKEVEDELKGDFILLYGDVMFDVDLNRLIEFHHNCKGIATLVVHPNDHPSDSDIVEVDENHRIIKFHPRPHDKNVYYPNLVSAALYMLSPRILRYVKKGVKADFGKDLFPQIVRDESLYGYNTAEYIKDVGTSERLEEVRRDYLSGKISRLNRKHKRGAVFIDRDGVVNKEVDLLHKVEDFELLPNVAESIRLINQSEYLSIVITNQSVIARNLCTFNELKNIHNKMDTLLGKEGAKLDAVYYCPHHPDKGFPEERAEYKIECECRKPRIGLIEKAARDFNIDLAQSFFIGDKGVDIKCGENAGIVTVGLRTGYGCKGSDVEPDYFFEDLSEAVEFILNEPYLKTFNAACERYLHHDKMKPYIILIGGNTRSGKTMLSRYLQHKFEKLGKSVLRIMLDNWLIPLESRENKDDVFARFQMGELERNIEEIFNGKQIFVQKYDSRTRSKFSEELCIRYSKEDIVIIEGVVALSSEELRNLADCKIYCTVDHGKHRTRICDFYKWKGLADNEIEDLYLRRSVDEYAKIEKSRVFADYVVET